MVNLKLPVICPPFATLGWSNEVEWLPLSGNPAADIPGEWVKLHFRHIKGTQVEQTLPTEKYIEKVEAERGKGREE